MDLSGTQLASWSGMFGVILLLTKDGSVGSSDTGFDLTGAVSSYSGTMIVAQAGDARYFGQRTPVKVFDLGNTYYVERDVGGGGYQTAQLNQNQRRNLGGESYNVFFGGTSGPGASGESSICLLW